ncbi:MAG: amidohydrolase family protein, partial [Acidimicrobiia bacterium]
VQLITQSPASLFGLRDRGEVREGAHADLVVFDPETVGSEDVHLVEDLPGGSGRLFAGAAGVPAVVVNGVPVVADAKITGALPGTVLRSGTDTETVPVPAGP